MGPSTHPSRVAAKLRFNHLRLIVALQEAGSLRRAANALHLTQSALSKALKELETAMGVQLYERLPGRLRISPAGDALFRAAKVMLSELEQVQVDVAAISSGGLPTIRIGATPFLAQTLVPDSLGELRRRDAAVRVELTEGPVPQLISLLCEGRLEVILATWMPSPGLAVADHLSIDVLRPESMLVIAHPASPLLARETVSLNDLVGQRWILPGASSLVRQIVDTAFASHGLRPPSVAIESMSPATNVAMVAQGLGIAALPGTAMMAAERSGIVRRLALSPAISCPPVTLVYRHQPVRSEKVEFFRAAITTVVERATVDSG